MFSMMMMMMCSGATQTRQDSQEVSAVHHDQESGWRLVRVVSAQQELQHLLLQRVHQGAGSGVEEETQEESVL